MSTSLFHKRDAYPVYLLMQGAVSFFFALIFTVNMVYQVTIVDLNPLQLVLVGTTLEMTVFLFEIPTGIVADVRSRRLSILIGYVLIGLGFVLEGLVPRFGAVLMGQVLWGLGYTFTSGATQAWIADEVGEARAGQAFLRGSQIGTVGGLIGIPLSVGLASLHIRLPIVLSGVLFAGLSVYLGLVMPEDGFKPTPTENRTTWQTMGHTFRSGLRLVRARTVLLLFVGIAVFFGLYSEGLDRLWTAHILENFALPGLGDFEPVVWFGVIGAISMLLSIGATEVVRRRVDMNDPNAILRTLFAVTALMVSSIFVFGLARRFEVALLALWTFSVFRSTSGPIFTAWINPHIESNVRATVFSMTGQVDAISQVAGGPVLGFIGTRASIRAAIVTSGIVLSPALVLLARARRLTGTARPDFPAAEPVAVE